MFFLILCHTGTVLLRACKQTVILSSLCLCYMIIPASAWLMFCGGEHANGWASFHIYTTIKLRFKSGRGVEGALEQGCKLRARFWEVIPNSPSSRHLLSKLNHATNKFNIWLYKRGSSYTPAQTHKRWTDHDECPLKNFPLEHLQLLKKNPSSHSGKTAVVSLTGYDHGKLSSYHRPDGTFALIHSVTQSCKNAKYAPVPWAWRLWGLYFLCITWQLFSISSPEATEIRFESCLSISGQKLH